MLKTLTERDYFMEITGLSVVEFWSPNHEWKVTSKLALLLLLELAPKFKNINFYRLNAESENGMAKRLRIMSVPTILLYKNGEVVDKLIRLKGEDKDVNNKRTVTLDVEWTRRVLKGKVERLNALY